MPNTRLFIASLLAGGALIAASNANAAPNLVTNGDFANIGSVWVNNTGLGSDDLQTGGATNIPGWSNVAGAANEFWSTTPNSYGLTQSPANASTYWVDLTGQANNKPYGGIDQTIATAIGATYTLTFDLGSSTAYNGTGSAQAALTASATGLTTEASKLFTLAPNSSNEWQSEQLTFTADSTSTTVEFLGDSDYTSQYTGLDNVSVVKNPTAVPEPASLALLGVALLGLGFVRRKVS